MLDLTTPTGEGGESCYAVEPNNTGGITTYSRDCINVTIQTESRNKRGNAQETCNGASGDARRRMVCRSGMGFDSPLVRQTEGAENSGKLGHL